MARTSRAPRAPNSQYDFLAMDYDEHLSDHHHHSLGHKEHEHLLQEIALLLGVAPPTGIPCLPGFTRRAQTPLRSITALMLQESLASHACHIKAWTAHGLMHVLLRTYG